MTQQRSNDEIRADIATVGYTTPDSASGWWATERLAADVPALLARVSELEQENVRLHGVIAHTASDVHDYVRAALADARTDLDSALARAERAEAQVRAVEELQGSERCSRCWVVWAVTTGGTADAPRWRWRLARL